tara:strand:- start:26 stop:751 length:726 start_codon:yes stop_codon:yes gene_type:complete
MGDKMITLDVEQILSESHKYNETGQSDFLSELILDFYKNGQYSYSQYKDENKPVPDNCRQQKGYIKRWMNTPEVKKYLTTIFQIIFEIDNSLPEKLRKEKIEMKTEINKLQYQLSSFKQSDIDIKEKAIQNEVELRLDHYVSARDERIQKQSQRIQTLTAEVLRYERLETEAKLLSRNSKDEEHTEQKDFIDELKTKIDNCHSQNYEQKIEIKQLKRKLNEKKKKKKKKKHSISSSESDSD